MFNDKRFLFNKKDLKDLKVMNIKSIENKYMKNNHY